MSAAIECPFKVGDRVHEVVYAGGYSVMQLGMEGVEVTSYVPMDDVLLDWSKPDATVTAITERGFEYRYDCKVPIGRAAWGSYTEGGECYPEGYPYWRKVE